MKTIAILAILFIPKILFSGWEIVATPTTKALNAVECIGYNCAYAVGDDRTLLYSSDYGETWDTVSAPDVSPGLDFNDLFFWDELEGIIVCDSGKIFFTSDGGASWIENTTPVSNRHFYAIDFSPSGAGLAAGTSGWIVQGPDSLWNWEDWRLPTYTTRNFYSVCHPEDDLAYVLARRDILRITAVGDTFCYEMVVDFITRNMNGMCTIEPGWVFVVGDSGTVLFSFDSLGSWNDLSPPSCADFNDIEFTYYDYGVICGDGGVIFESGDYGLSWDSITSGTTRNLNDVDFWWDGYGLIVGNYGTILRSATAVGIKDKLERPKTISLTAYPNPFNSSVRIEVEGECDSPMQIEIYDVAGRKIVESPPAPLIKGGAECNEAVGSYIWQPDESLPSGVYLVRAVFGEGSIAKRVVYLK